MRFARVAIIGLAVLTVAGGLVLNERSRLNGLARGMQGRIDALSTEYQTLAESTVFAAAGRIQWSATERRMIDAARAAYDATSEAGELRGRVEGVADLHATLTALVKSLSADHPAMALAGFQTLRAELGAAGSLEPTFGAYNELARQWNDGLSGIGTFAASAFSFDSLPLPYLRSDAAPADAAP